MIAVTNVVLVLLLCQVGWSFIVKPPSKVLLKWSKMKVVASEGSSAATSPPHEVSQVDVNAHPDVVRQRDVIDKIYEQVAAVQDQASRDRATLKSMEEQYGPEIERIKAEFLNIKNRTYAEHDAAMIKSKIDAFKELLPVTDNFMRIKQLYPSFDSDRARQIFDAYAVVCQQFVDVIENSGLSRVESVGKPFDYNFMEAIATAPSTEYPAKYVCTEYQVGYRMGDKCVRPSMVVVSSGPGPS